MKKIIFFLFLIFTMQLFFAGDEIFTEIVIPGFDFEGGNFSTSLEKKAQDKIVQHAHTPNQIVIGHSQGGLTGLGYIAKEKELNGDSSNIKAFLTVNSPVRGFAGLDYGYEIMRERIIAAAQIHASGIASVFVAQDPFIGTILSLIKVEHYGNAFLAIVPFLDFVATTIEGEKKNVVPMKGLISTLINKKTPDSSIQEILDMSRAYPYIKNHVGPTTIKVVQIAPIYPGGLPLFYFVFDQDHSNVRNDIPIGHVVGKTPNPLDLQLDDKKKKEAQDLLGIFNIVYTTGEIVNRTRALIAGPFGFLFYWMHADRCADAKNWIQDFSQEWATLIGGNPNDGFIAVQSQFLKGVRREQIKLLDVDHASSTPGEKNFKNWLIWGEGRAKDQIIDAMRLSD